MPRDVLLDERESAAPWAIHRPFSDIVREAVGGYAQPRTLKIVLHLLSEALLHEGGDYHLYRKMIIQATALLMTTEYDMLDDILTLLQKEYGYDLGEYVECEYPSLAVE